MSKKTALCPIGSDRERMERGCVNLKNMDSLKESNLGELEELVVCHGKVASSLDE